MTLIDKPEMARALARRIKKYSKEVYSYDDHSKPSDIEVAEVGDSGYLVGLIWYDIAEKSNVRQFYGPIRDYFEDLRPDDRVIVRFERVTILHGTLKVTLQIYLEEW